VALPDGRQERGDPVLVLSVHLRPDPHEELEQLQLAEVGGIVQGAPDAHQIVHIMGSGQEKPLHLVVLPVLNSPDDVLDAATVAHLQLPYFCVFNRIE